MTTIVKRMLEKQTQATPMKIVVSPNSESSSKNNFVTAKPKSQNVLWSRLPIVSWKRATGGGVVFVFVYVFVSVHVFVFVYVFLSVF